MLIRALSALLIALVAGTFVVVAQPRAETAFSDEQKAQVEQIIRDYLLEHPELMLEVMQRLEEKQKAAARDNTRKAIGRHRAALFESDGDFVVNAAGEVPMVEFFDYQCGYCKKILGDVMRLTREASNVRIIFKEFPILGEVSRFAAKAALAARKQDKYMEFHTAVMGLRRGLSEEVVMMTAAEIGLDVERLKQDMTSPEIEQTINENLALAQLMDIRGTPTLIVGDNLVPGAISYERMLALIDEAATDCRVC